MGLTLECVICVHSAWCMLKDLSVLYLTEVNSSLLTIIFLVSQWAKIYLDISHDQPGTGQLKSVSDCFAVICFISTKPAIFGPTWSNDKKVLDCFPLKQTMIDIINSNDSDRNIKRTLNPSMKNWEHFCLGKVKHAHDDFFQRFLRLFVKL